MRLIDADELIEGLCAECSLKGDQCPEINGQECDWDIIHHVIKAPTVDPVRHGHWIIGKGWFQCSCHGGRYYDESINAEKRLAEPPLYWKRCPSCGAVIDEPSEVYE